MQVSGYFSIGVIQKGDEGQSVAGFFSSVKTYTEAQCIDYSSRKGNVNWPDDCVRESKDGIWLVGNRIQLIIRCENGDNYITYQKVVDRNTLYPLSYSVIKKGDPGKSVAGFFTSAYTYPVEQCVDYCTRKDRTVYWGDDEIREPRGSIWVANAIIQLTIRCENGNNYVSIQRVIDSHTLQPLSYYIQYKGSNGDKGNPGAKMRCRLWTANTAYTAGVGSEPFYDIVIHDSKRYLCLKSHTSVASVPPPTSISKHEGRWAAAQEWEFIATKLILTDLIKANQIDTLGLDLGGSIFVRKEGISTSETPNEFPIVLDQTNFTIAHDYLIYHATLKDKKDQNNTNLLRIEPDYLESGNLTGNGVLTIEARTKKNRALSVKAGQSVFSDTVVINHYNDSALEVTGATKIIGNTTIKADKGGFVKIGGMHLNTRTITKTNEVINSDDDYIEFNADGDIEVTLPTNCEGKVLWCKQANGNRVTFKNAYIVENKAASNNATFNPTFGKYACAYQLLKRGSHWIQFVGWDS